MCRRIRGRVWMLAGLERFGYNCAVWIIRGGRATVSDILKSEFGHWACVPGRPDAKIGVAQPGDGSKLPSLTASR